MIWSMLLNSLVLHQAGPEAFEEHQRTEYKFVPEDAPAETAPATEPPEPVVEPVAAPVAAPPVPSPATETTAPPSPPTVEDLQRELARRDFREKQFEKRLEELTKRLTPAPEKKESKLAAFQVPPELFAKIASEETGAEGLAEFGRLVAQTAVEEYAAGEKERLEAFYLEKDRVRRLDDFWAKQEASFYGRHPALEPEKDVFESYFPDVCAKHFVRDAAGNILKDALGMPRFNVKFEDIMEETGALTYARLHIQPPTQDGPSPPKPTGGGRQPDASPRKVDPKVKHMLEMREVPD